MDALARQLQIGGGDFNVPGWNFEIARSAVVVRHVAALLGGVIRVREGKAVNRSLTIRAPGCSSVVVPIPGGPCRSASPAQTTTTHSPPASRFVSQLYLALTLLILIVLALEITAALAS